jgi:F-type H+-transporting ATPase subunit delta
MAEAITIARPYAQAAFQYAEASRTLPDWADMLELLSAIVVDPEMEALIDNPQLTETQQADLRLAIGGEHRNEKCHNYIRLLAENQRLKLVPEITALFEILRQQAEGTVKASLVTAYPASATQQEEVIAGLKRRLGKEIELECTTDASLLGGAIIRAGDLVIDGSVRGKLERLGNTLSH